MEYPNDADAYQVGGHLHTALTLAIADIASMPEGEQRTWALRGVASLLMGIPETLKATAVEQCPELASAVPIPDTHLSVEEEEIASRLTTANVQALDCALIAGAVTSWRKVARVVGDAMVTLQGQGSDLPLGVYMRRVQALVQDARLEAQGSTQFMRFSEVRLPTKGTSAA
jgi:Protein of unknown function